MNGFMTPYQSPYASFGNYGSPLIQNQDYLSQLDNQVSPLFSTDYSMGGNLPVSPLGEAASTGPGLMSMSSFLGNAQMPGWGGLALGAAQGLMSGFMGMQQYGIAKDALKENKRQFSKNFQAQRTTTNSALEDRQRARIASNPDAYESVGDYMKRNGV